MGPQGPRGQPIDARYEGISTAFDRFAEEADAWAVKTDGYHGLITSVYDALVPKGMRVLEIGCGRGDLLAAMDPSRGVGVDVSERMIEAAHARHPSLEFVHASGESIALGETFDYVILSDLVPYVDDLQKLFDVVGEHCHARSRVIVNTYSNVWRGPLWLLALLGMRPHRPIRNWVSPRDLTDLFELAGFDVITSRKEILLPVRGRLAGFVNGALARLPGVRQLALTDWQIARPAPRSKPQAGVTVVVPCRNEAGAIESIVERVPSLGSGTELLFIEGGSTDETQEAIREAIERHPERDLRLMVQTGRGKANAVHEAFAEAKHEILMILDADLTVAPEDLPKFYEALVSGRGEMINGSRLVYGMEEGAMRFLNLIGNRVFALILSAVLGQYVKDTLCGTKALYRDDYLRIAAQQDEVPGKDPFGDFDLLIGASLAGLKILNVPVRYGARFYGETNIDRFSGGSQLARLAAGGFQRIWMSPVER